MVETEMSLQSDLIKSNNPSQISSYTKIDVDEDTDTNSIPKNDITPPSIDISETSSKIINNTIIINGKTYSVNSDQNRPITHKYFYSKLGNTHTFFGDDKGNPLIIIGPHWPLFVLVNLGSTIFFFVVIIIFWKFISNSLKLLGFSLYFLFLLSYGLTGLINPGYPEHDENTLKNKNKNKTGFCTVCKIWLSLEKKTKHCNHCNICVEGMDHHCPWTGKCIGRKNIIPFYIFVISFLGFMIYCILIFSLSNDKLNKKIKK